MDRRALQCYPFPTNSFRAFCTNVFDAQEVELLIDLGFRVHAKILVHLSGVKMPSLNSDNAAEREEADKAKAQLCEWLIPWGFKNVVDMSRWPVHFFSRQGEHHGLWSGVLYTHDKDGTEICINHRLVELGYGILVKET